jgi:hypothetical protein
MSTVIELGRDDYSIELVERPAEPLAEQKGGLPTKRADRIRVLLARREEAEQEVARELQEEKSKVGTAKWLHWCEREFGWAKRQAYAHLSPAQLQAARERATEHQSRVRKLRTPEPAPREDAKRAAKVEEPVRERLKVIFGNPLTKRRRALVVEMIHAGFRQLAKTRHPDVGGSHEAMAELADARDWGIDNIEHPPAINFDID